MDPFTQRMLERAKARRAKLDSQLSNAGHDVKKRRSPLKDANAILEQAPGLNPTSSVSLFKETKKESPLSMNATRKSSLTKSSSDDTEENRNKENGESSGGMSVKTKLQRLGKLYSEDCTELSSPIHRTEEKFATDNEQPESKPAKNNVRLNRLAALASTINNWEDDLPQPITKPVAVKANSTRQLKWDSKVLQSLEAQGFSRTESNSRLVYEYKNQETGNLQKSPVKPSTSALQKPLTPDKNLRTEAVKKPDTNSKTPDKNFKTPDKNSKTPDKNLKTPDKNSVGETVKTPDKNGKPGVSTSRITSRFPYNGSPKSPVVQSPGSVLSKASIFESKSSQTKVKDPAEMSLSERKALFEKNNTGVPLIPKAPLTMSVPTKMLLNNDKPQNNGKIETGKAVGVQRAKFEQGTKIQELENNILQSVQNERQRELEMLRSRFNRNKEVVQAAAGSCIRTISESSEGKSNSLKNSPICPVKPTPAPDHVPVPPPMPKIQNVTQSSNIIKASPSKRQVVGSPPKSYTHVAADIKRIKVSPGRLYPDLRSIEIESTETETEYTVSSSEPETATFGETTETETITEGEYQVQDDSDDESTNESDLHNSSLGRSILHAVGHKNVLNKKRSIEPDPDSSMSDISVLDEMDEYLDECLANQDDGDNADVKNEGPTPTKIHKGVNSPSHACHSFKYKHGNHYRSPVILSTPSPRKETFVMDGDKSVPLMHSVSFYRKQQSQTPKTTAKVIITRSPTSDSDAELQNVDKNEATLVQDKVKRLLDEVCKQESIIGQASQALNLCTSTIEFSGSREQVEGERLLLLATHRRQAALQEVQRLRVEGSLRPVIPGSSEVQESGSLTISAITLPLKKDFFLNMKPDSCLHFVCLVRHLDVVVATPVVQIEIGDSCLRFPSTLKLQDLYSDFKVTVEVYSLETSAEILPHEVKYHIHNSGNNNAHCSSKKITGKTPKKFLKQESRLIMPNVQSPAGPSAVRSPAFSLAGYVVFSLKEVHRQNFTLNKIPESTPLEGRLQMHAECELSVSVEYRGFLTMFEDISGYGMWYRRWCLLKGTSLSYWKYPDDERKKTPIGSLDLQDVSTTNVGFVSRDICARPYTLLLETIRPALPTDVTSLVMIKKGSQTIIRHLLSADTKEDGLEWCAKINKTLHLIRAWGGSSST